MNETTDATAIFAPIWRRKWLILAVAIVVAGASYLYYRNQRPTYQASTQVYLGAGAEGQALTEKASSKSRGPTATQQAAVINLIIVERVRRKLRSEHKGALARGSKVRAKAEEKSEFISITAEAHNGRGAAVLANLTAQTYVKRQNVNYQRSIAKSIAISRRQLRRIELTTERKLEPKPSKGQSGSTPSSSSSGASSTPSPTAPSSASVLQAATLSSRINQLESSLDTATAEQVKPAKPNASLLLSPKPRKDAIFGFVIGLVLASIAAYAVSRFDRRLRSLETIEAVFSSPILAALPRVRRPIVRGAGFARPSAILLEPLRRLHTALQLTYATDPGFPASNGGRVVVFVSADPGDGKSTLVANLAMIQREAGERTVVVEANFRRPVQAGLLGLDGAHGLADVLDGRLRAEEAMQRVLPVSHATVTQPGESAQGVATAVQSDTGSLFVLAGGGPVANPPAMLAGEPMSDLLRSLAADFDYVLIDAPSPLEVSDVMPLLGAIAGIVVVARVGYTHETSAERLQQLLERPTNAPVLGVVANFVARKELNRYGFSSPSRRPWPGRTPGR